MLNKCHEAWLVKVALLLSVVVMLAFCCWLNMAECEFSVMARRIANSEMLPKEICAWQNARNQSDKPADWRFTTEDARTKHESHYPKVSDG
ncbi:MAG: hypothetical protein V3U76_07340 [Granulosicoccus sp.]